MSLVDSIGLAAPNDPALGGSHARRTRRIRRRTGAVRRRVTTRPIREAFMRYLDIARPLDRTTDLLAMSASIHAMRRRCAKLSEGVDGAEPADADLLDLLQAFPSARPTLAGSRRIVAPLRPRPYSIASSLRATPGQVHLCAASRARQPARSGAPRCRQRIPREPRGLGRRRSDAYIQTSHFRLPGDPAVPVIMVGPGTGIAPFRAFLAERAVAGIRGRTWLLFGERNRATDFLYGTELKAWRNDGTLSRLDIAFSRDQRRKIYVQDRMAENAEDLWRWLQDGAHFYVCGDATRMAKDVDAALRRLAMTEGRLNESQARDWIVALARQDRYLRDVY